MQQLLIVELMVAHRALHWLGEYLAGLAILAIVAAGFVGVALGSFLLCMFGGYGLAYELGEGNFVAISAVVVLSGFWGNYVWSAHLRPALGRAFGAVTRAMI
jgi:hypothetical protein